MNYLAELSLQVSSDLALALVGGAGTQFFVVIKMLWNIGQRLTAIETRVGIVEASKSKCAPANKAPFNPVTERAKA